MVGSALASAPRKPAVCRPPSEHRYSDDVTDSGSRVQQNVAVAGGGQKRKGESTINLREEGGRCRSKEFGASKISAPPDIEINNIGLNTRCTPKVFIDVIDILTPAQFNEISRLGFGDVLKMQTQALDTRELIWWLNRIDPCDMSIHLDRGRRLKMEPSHLNLVLGLPYGGEDIRRYNFQEGCRAVKALREELEILEGGEIKFDHLKAEIAKKRVDSLMLGCFFMMLSNRVLFHTGKYNIGQDDVTFALEPYSLGSVDLCKAIFQDLRWSVKEWQNPKKAVKFLTAQGCQLFLVLFFVDNILHPITQKDPFTRPRSAVWTKSMLDKVVKDSKSYDSDGKFTFDDVELKAPTSTCYGVGSVQEDPALSPSRADPPTSRDDLCSFHLPRMRELVSAKLKLINGSLRQEAEAIITKYDEEILVETNRISRCQRRIWKKQIDIAETIGRLIDTAAHAPSNQELLEHTREGSRQPSPATHCIEECRQPSPGLTSESVRQCSQLPDHATTGPSLEPAGHDSWVAAETHVQQNNVESTTTSHDFAGVPEPDTANINDDGQASGRLV